MIVVQALVAQAASIPMRESKEEAMDGQPLLGNPHVEVPECTQELCMRMRMIAAFGTGARLTR